MKKKKSYDMGSGLLKPMIGLASVTVLVCLIWYAAANKDSIMAEDVTPTLIAAPETPLKERVEGETGAIVPYQDMEVFDLLKTTTPVQNAENQVVCATTPDGQVRCGEELAQAEKRVETMIEHAKNEEVTSLQDVQKLPPKQPKETFNLTETTDPLAGLIAQETEVEKTVTEAPKKVVQKVEATAQKAAPKVEPKIEVVTSTATAKGPWGVQLASFGSEGDAERAIDTFKTKHKTLLSDLRAVVQQATVNGKNVFRVQFLGMNSSTEAGGLCTKLKAAGQGCFKVKS